MAKSPDIVSNLSAILNINPAVVVGISSPENPGRYCSAMAKLTISFSSACLAYSIPILPCNSGNSLTVFVTKSALER